MAAVIKDWQPHIAILEAHALSGDIAQSLKMGGNGEAGIPILALTPLGDLQTKLTAFEHGVDDILSLPFSPEELLARVLAIVRRAYGRRIALRPTIKLGDIEIDILNHQVKVDNHVLSLTGVDVRLLYFLAANAGRLVTRDEILDAVWGTDFLADSNVVDRHVRNLRAKLQNNWRRPRFIATVAGKGYQFLPQVDIEPVS